MITNKLNVIAELIGQDQNALLAEVLEGVLFLDGADLAGIDVASELSGYEDKICELHMSRCKLPADMGWLPKFPNLYHIDIDGCSLTELPDIPWHVRRISASDNRIKTICNLPRELESIALYNNPLESINHVPESLNEISFDRQLFWDRGSITTTPTHEPLWCPMWPVGNGKALESAARRLTNNSTYGSCFVD